MTELTGTWALVRFVVRRDRVRILVWVAAIVVLVVSTAASTKGLFPTQADLDEAAAASEDNAAAIAFNGPAVALDTIGGQVAFQVGTFGLIVVGLMSLFTVGRLTRAEEESGRADLVRSMAVGRHAPTAAALVVAAGMSVVVGIMVGLGLLSQDLPAGGSLVLGASFTAMGLVFAAIALVAAQVTENTRVVSGISGAVLGAAFVLRAAGDVGDGTLSWLSPIGWSQKTRPYAGDLWWPLLVSLVATAGLAVVAGVLTARRDVGAGLVPPRPGPPVAGAGLAHPLGLAVRLQRGSLVAWAAGVLLVGVSYGSVANDVEDFVGDNEALADMIAQSGGASLTDSFLATTQLMLALIGAGFAVQAALRLRSEEGGLRAEPLLATPVSRWRWAASHLVVAWVGAVIVLVMGGLGSGVTYAIVADDAGGAPRLVGAALAYAPAVWLLVAVVVLLFGLLPRGALLAWSALALCFVVALLGEVFDFPTWVSDASPFQHIPQMPVADLDLAPLAVLTALAAALTWVGLTGFRQRDVG
jgi:ABC-2 type transport system permease protein